MKNPTRFADYVYAITSELHRLGLEMIKESLEEMDRMIQENPVRMRCWTVERHTKKRLITSLGEVCFNKTLYRNKNTGCFEYLIDRILDIGPKERITEDALAKLLEEAVQTSYRRGGENASLTTNLSKQTVKNKIHNLEIPRNGEDVQQKKVVDYLYIDADEDHVSLQFRERKGDLTENELHRKNNCMISKLVYVYEGIEKEALESKRHRLVNPHYFCSTNSGEENQDFWDEIYQYMDQHYELDKVKKIYVNSDGGNWIMAGIRRIAGAKHVLDEFHLEKYLTKLTSHMLDSKEDATTQLRAAIKDGTKQEFQDLVAKLKEYLPDETGNKRMDEAEQYVLSNWSAAKTRLKHRDGICGSSTEGHVSHVLSSRMSSRPMGWSVIGATKMAQLRAYTLNGGNMLELVRYQKKELPKAAGAEYDVLSASDIMQSEKRRHGELGKYMECITHSLPEQCKIKAYMRNHIRAL